METRSGDRTAALALAVLGVCALVTLGPVLRVRAEDEAPEPVAKAEDEYLLREPWWAFLDATTSRKEVRDRLVTWAGGEPDGRFRGGGARGAVHAWIKILDSMLLEDAAHESPAGALSELSTEARITELIFLLRDVTGSGVFANGGPPDVFATPGLDEVTAADLLAREGHAAVPALIAALGDERLTRCAGDPRGGGHPMVWRVGDAALKILTRIAGRPFAQPEGATPVHDFGASLRPVAAVWWGAVQEKGEFLATADELQSATMSHMDVQLAKRLATLDPHAATPLVVRVTRTCTDPMRRKLLLDVLGGLSGPGGVEFLRRELGRGPFLLHRVTAAYGLRGHGEDKRATDAMRAAWRGPLDFGTHANAQWARWTVRAGVHQTVAFLASSKDASVVAELGLDLAKRPAHMRAVVAQMLGGGVVEYQLMGYFGTYHHLDGVKGIDDTVARRLLRPLLDDVAVTGPHAHPWGAPQDTRVADLAAAALARREPNAFKFVPAAKTAVRDEAIAAIRAALGAVPERD